MVWIYKLIILLSGENSYFYQEILDEINSLKVGKKVSGKKLSGFDAISRSTFWSEFMTLTFLSGLSSNKIASMYISMVIEFWYTPQIQFSTDVNIFRWCINRHFTCLWSCTYADVITRKKKHYNINKSASNLSSVSYIFFQELHFYFYDILLVEEELNY